MLLSEGTIIIPHAERNHIYAYVDDLKAFLAPFFNKGPQDAMGIMRELNSEFSPQWDKKVGKNLYYIRYEYDKNKRAGSYYTDGQSIYLNFFYLGNARLGSGGVIMLTGVDYDRLTSTLMHEFAHYKQDMKHRSKRYGRMLVHITPKDMDAYFQNPIEQHAWAVGYLEKLKKKAKVSKPEEVLSSLRSVGLLHDPTIHALKQTDYDSWKAIMKHAIRTAMHDLSKKSAA